MRDERTRYRKTVYFGLVNAAELSIQGQLLFNSGVLPQLADGGTEVLTLGRGQWAATQSDLVWCCALEAPGTGRGVGFLAGSLHEVAGP